MMEFDAESLDVIYACRKCATRFVDKSPEIRWHAEYACPDYPGKVTEHLHVTCAVCLWSFTAKTADAMDPVVVPNT